MKTFSSMITIIGMSLFTKAETRQFNKLQPTHKYQIHCDVGNNDSTRSDAVQISTIEFSTFILMRDKNNLRKSDAFTKSGLLLRLRDRQGKQVVVVTGDDTVFGKRLSDVDYNSNLFNLQVDLNNPTTSKLSIGTYRDLNLDNLNMIETISAHLGDHFTSNASLTYDRPIPPYVSVNQAIVSDCVTRITKL